MFTAGAAFAALGISKSLTASVNVISGPTAAGGSPDFAFFSDSAATVPVSSVSLPDITPGGTSSFTIYVKNTGSIAETISAGSNTIPATTGTLTLTFDGASQKNLATGAICKVSGTLQAASTAVAGPVNFTFTINAEPGSTGSSGGTTTLNGQQIFAANCSACHSAGTVNTSRTQSQLLSFIPGHQTGRNLTSAEVNAVAVFIKP